jgi:hypothetical protein
MLRAIACVATLSFVASIAHAQDVLADIGRDGYAGRIAISDGARGKIVKIYDGDRLIGSFDNLIVEKMNISSTIVPMMGGGLAISADSDGSRDKYHIIAPIHKIGDKFFVGCVYKAVYDSVDEIRSVGSTCENIELSKFDISNAITDADLFSYKSDQDWLADFKIKNCKDSSGFKYGDYYVIRCSSEGAGDAKNASITVANSSKEVLLSLTGFDIFPDKTMGIDGFFANADLFDQTIPFYGKLSCFTHNGSSAGGPPHSAKIGGQYPIKYDLSVIRDGCLTGSYFYESKNIPINLIGMSRSGMGYLLEQDKNRAASGLFLLSHFSDTLQGDWIGVPPKKALQVN